MTGSPKERRAHAMVCSRLAETLPGGRSRQMFAALAKSWLELATDVENSQALPDTCSDLSQPYRFASRIVDYGLIAVNSSSLVGGFTQLRGRNAKLCTMVPT